MIFNSNFLKIRVLCSFLYSKQRYRIYWTTVNAAGKNWETSVHFVRVRLLCNGAAIFAPFTMFVYSSVNSKRGVSRAGQKCRNWTYSVVFIPRNALGTQKRISLSEGKTIGNQHPSFFVTTHTQKRIVPLGITVVKVSKRAQLPTPSYLNPTPPWKSLHPLYWTTSLIKQVSVGWTHYLTSPTLHIFVMSTGSL